MFDNIVFIGIIAVIIIVVVDWYNGWKLTSKLSSIEKEDLSNLISSFSDIKSKIDEIKSNDKNYEETINDIKDLIKEIEELKSNLDKISSDINELKEKTNYINNYCIKENSLKKEENK